MLQRKQSLFLIAAMFLIVSNLFVPFISSQDLIFNSFRIDNLSTDANIVINTFPIAIYAIILVLVHLFAFFLFKNRPLQMRITMLSLLLSIAFYGIILFYHFMSQSQIKMEFNQYGFGLITPILAAVFDFMAYNGIKKDEKIVRDADRFR